MELYNGYVIFNEIKEKRTFAGGLEGISKADSDLRTATGIVEYSDPQTNLKAGDKILFSSKSQFDVHVDDKIKTVVHFRDIIGKIDESTK